ncbi:phytoene/squalene synthase family protein [Bacillus altitudinis]|uniref:phytoene/squalene synthase family protein n=1 Tax=Bacillus altitudinis TaxID=293387 RepID=UPI00031F5682|nr:phytoene/squalene synthase family protein [Bacillus altitudinis]MCL7872387.1 squalene/phytoene synthase family protein [Bacillus altitudinis]MDI6646635.1 phytoene/squalene synthase family protein [Bacillus altitudinis]MDI6661255.1 phytoene/squalene synthase family protein [Bacillus altitudinis]WOI42378.1 phytoene/squalene synthase family protein [Bacillus altitudinis]
MVDVQTALKICEETIQTHSKTFYRAFSMLPKKKRQAVWAVYSFCRRADDIVDESPSPKEELTSFQEAFDRFLQGEVDRDDPMWVALEYTFQQFRMDEAPFRDLLRGQEMDLEQHRYETLDELLIYSYHVASTVGLMLLPIIAPRKKEQLKEAAISLGIGMQLTNILRDIGEDKAERNRIYLPKQVMDQFGYTEQELQEGIVNQAFQHVWEYIAFEAEAYYEEFFDHLHEFPLYSRIPVKAAAHFYKAILDKTRENEYRVFTKRSYISTQEKALILEDIT